MFPFLPTRIISGSSQKRRFRSSTDTYSWHLQNSADFEVGIRTKLDHRISQVETFTQLDMFVRVKDHVELEKQCFPQN